MTLAVIRTYAETFKRPRDPAAGTRRECWAATTHDGQWRFERLDEPRTPWRIVFHPGHADEEVADSRFGSLNAALEAVDRGWLVLPSQWQQEHNRVDEQGTPMHRRFPNTLDCPSCHHEDRGHPIPRANCWLCNPPKESSG